VNYLLDTSVVSELVRKQPDPVVVAWLAAQTDETLFLSVLTVGELQKGVSNLPDSKRKARLESWLTYDLTVRFRERLLPVDVAVALAWGTLQGESLRRGMPLPVIDCLLTATAVVHDLVVVTHNVTDFERCGANVFDPWDSASL
jgi:predicted nucleic acid-binding protein